MNTTPQQRNRQRIMYKKIYKFDDADFIGTELEKQSRNQYGPNLLEQTENMTVNQAIRFIIKNSKTPNAAMNMISRYKSTLSDEDKIKVDRNKFRLKNQDKANKQLEERREERHNNPINIPDELSLKNVKKRLKNYIESPLNLYSIIDIMIAFSARPSELYNLHFKGYKIGGHLKQRDADNYYQYRGLYRYSDAKKVLERLKDYPELNPSIDTVRQTLEKIMREAYGLQLRDLRQIGANYVVDSTKDPDKKRINKQYALRHKNISTSTVNYDRE